MKKKTDTENLIDAFKRGVDYSKRFKSFKEEVREEKNWGLRVRVSAILLTLVVGAIVGSHVGCFVGNVRGKYTSGCNVGKLVGAAAL